MDNTNLPVLKMYCRHELIRGKGNKVEYFIPEEWGGPIWVSRVSLRKELSKISYTPQEWFDRWILGIVDSSQRPKCIYCSNTLYFRRLSEGYRSNTCGGKTCKSKLVSKKLKLIFSSLEIRKKMSESAKRAKSSLEARKMISESMKRTWSNPERRKKQSEIVKQSMSSPEVRKKNSESIKRAWTNPEYREKLKSFWESGGCFGYMHKHPEKYPNFNGGGKHKKFRRGYHNSIKCGKIYYYSSWELYFMKQLDEKENVVKYSNRLSIPYKHIDGSNHSYIPDLLIEYSDGKKELVEIKPARYIEDEINQLKFKAGEGYAKSLGWDWKILTEKEIFGDVKNWRKVSLVNLQEINI
jgi:hypothetical protein